jgi:hypothetical protein
MRFKSTAAVLLASLAALALALVPFALAEEAAPEFQAENSPAKVDAFATGQNLHEQYIRVTNEKGENLDVKCNTRSATLSTATTFPRNSLKTSMGFGECAIAGMAAGSAFTNECEYEFSLVAASNPATATLSILCAAGKEIKFESFSGCVIRIPPQKGLKHVLYSNNETVSPPDVTETFSITGLEYTIAKGCPNQTKTETKTNGIDTDGLTMRGTVLTESLVGFWVK